MQYRSTITARRELTRLAQSQGGYFTARQAASVGYGRPHLEYHVGTGNFERVGRGVYRLGTFPPDEHDDLIRLSFWSRGYDDQPQAVVSYASALAVHALGDLLPASVHLTVPRSFRKRPPAGCVLHKGDIKQNDVEIRAGFSVTTPLRTIVDVASSRSVTQDQLNEILKDALNAGLVQRKQVVERALAAGSERLSTALDATA